MVRTRPSSSIFAPLAGLVLALAILLGGAVDAAACESEVNAASVCTVDHEQVAHDDADHGDRDGERDQHGTCAHGHCHHGSQHVRALTGSNSVRISVGAHPPFAGAAILQAESDILTQPPRV